MTSNDDDRVPTNTPELYSDFDTPNGLAAVALFVVMAAIVGTAQFGEAAGFPQDASITASIGYAMFDVSIGGIDAPLVDSESFLVAFEIIDVVLVAALVGGVMLARRETDEGAGILTDGGRRMAAAGRRMLGREAGEVEAAGGAVAEDVEASGDPVADDVEASGDVIADDDGDAVGDDVADDDVDDATHGGER